MDSAVASAPCSIVRALDSDSVANNFINAFMMVAFRVKMYAYPNSAD